MICIRKLRRFITYLGIVCFLCYCFIMNSLIYADDGNNYNNKVIVDTGTNINGKDTIENGIHQTVTQSIPGMSQTSIIKNTISNLINNDTEVVEENHKMDPDYHLALRNMSALHKVKRLFYNRIPKCGSVTVGAEMSKMARARNFKHVASSIYDPPWLDRTQQEKVARDVSNLHEPFLYNRHLCFLDFESFKYAQVTYVNVVREPISRFVSNYYFQRSFARTQTLEPLYRYEDINDCMMDNFTLCTSKAAFLTLTYFCGHQYECRLPTISTLQKAKLHAAKHYAVVGITEDLKTYYQILECVLPQYFLGILKKYNSKSVQNKTKHKGKVLNEENKRKLSEFMKLEIDFYFFLKARVYYLKEQLIKTNCTFI